MAAAPDEMDMLAQLFPSEQGAICRLDLCYCGDPRIGNDLLRPLRALKPQRDDVRVMSYLKAQRLGGFLAAPVAHFQTGLFLPELSGAVMAAIVTAVNDAPQKAKLIILSLHGAISRAGPSDTAFALRQPGYQLDIVCRFSIPEEKTGAVQWVQALREKLQPFANGVCVNQLGETSEALVRTAYGPNYARLAAIKQKYDPNNVLQLNQNIKPPLKLV
jgi:Berberine and berberine like